MKAIIAINRAGYIGLKNGLPWKHNKADMEHFRAYTDGKIMLAGTTTYELLKDKLQLGNRQLLRYHRGLDDESINRLIKHPNVVVIGGAQTYQALAPYVRHWELSLIDDWTKGDCYFPAARIAMIRQLTEATCNVNFF